jgi:pimeloyl-ACP methyl ester carboxylesterase
LTWFFLTVTDPAQKRKRKKVMPKIRVNDLDLYFEVHGDGLPLVFVHGGGGNHVSWYQQVPYFSKWYKVVVYDVRGYGNSSPAQEGMNSEQLVEDLKGLLDHLDIKETALVCQSLGGWTCLGFTVCYPERVRALVMSDTGGGITAPGQLAQRQAEVRKATEYLTQLERVVSTGFVEREPERAYLYTAISSLNPTQRVPGGSGGGPGPGPQLKYLERIKCPVFFIVGEEDVLFPPDIAQMVYKLVPGASLVIVPNTGHSIYYERADAYNLQLYSFLRSSGYF